MSLAYEQYLRSPHWKTFAKEYRETHRHSCEFCHSRKKTAIHHVSYKRLGHEKPSDVVLLCELCHSEVHRLLKSGEAQDLRNATNMVRARHRKNGQFSALAVRGKERQALKERNQTSRAEIESAFEYAIFK